MNAWDRIRSSMSRLRETLVVPELIGFACLGIAAWIGYSQINTSSSPGSWSPTTSSVQSLEERLFINLQQRRTWRCTAVKIWLSRPTVVARLIPTGDSPRLIHAWGDNENDYGIAMMRLNAGDTLYALSSDEFEELRARAQTSPDR